MILYLIQILIVRINYKNITPLNLQMFLMNIKGVQGIQNKKKKKIKYTM
jgi:hypothetical protein